MGKQEILEHLNQTLVDALAKEAPIEDVEIVAQVAGQVALGEIKVVELETP